MFQTRSSTDDAARQSCNQRCSGNVLVELVDQHSAFPRRLCVSAVIVLHINSVSLQLKLYRRDAENIEDAQRVESIQALFQTSEECCQENKKLAVCYTETAQRRPKDSKSLFDI